MSNGSSVKCLPIINSDITLILHCSQIIFNSLILKLMEIMGPKGSRIFCLCAQVHFSRHNFSLLEHYPYNILEIKFFRDTKEKHQTNSSQTQWSFTLLR